MTPTDLINDKVKPFVNQFLRFQYFLSVLLWSHRKDNTTNLHWKRILKSMVFRILKGNALFCFSKSKQKKC
jgi:hypothetical protein